MNRNWEAEMKHEIKTGKKYQGGWAAIGSALIGAVVNSVVSSIFSPKQKSAPQQQSVYAAPPTPPAAAPVVAQPIVPISNADDVVAAQNNSMIKKIAGYQSSEDTKKLSKTNRLTTALGGGITGVS
jgi:hypothetical protein